MSTQSTTMMEHPLFILPDVAATDTGFTQEELAEDIDGLQLGFQRVKIPSGGQVQFELPGEDPDNPDYSKTLEGVIVYSHNANSYWPAGEDYDDNTPPSCQSTDGKVGYGAPGGLCTDCPYNRYGSDTKGTGRGKACKNQRIIYLLRSGEAMPIQLSLSPTSITPYAQFVNTAFASRRRGVCGSVVQIGLKKKNNGKGNVFYDLRRSWTVKGEGLFPDQRKTIVEKGRKLLGSTVSLTLCEAIVKYGRGRIEDRVRSEFHRDLFFDKSLEIEVINLRAARVDKRDILQDLQDVANGIEVIHAADSLKAAKAQKRARREAAKARKIRKAEAMVLSHGWDGLEDMWKRRAEKLLDGDRIDELLQQRQTPKTAPPKETQLSLFLDEPDQPLDATYQCTLGNTTVRKEHEPCPAW